MDISWVENSDEYNWHMWLILERQTQQEFQEQ